MEKDWKLLSPLGVSDVLEGDCALKRRIETAVDEALSSFGYNEIQTPTFEYFDVFADDLSIPVGDVIKFIDKSGRVLALRPDYTTALSRLVASHKSEAPLPLRLRYKGNIFRSSESYTEARQREFTQAGAELFGAEGPEADAELEGAQNAIALLGGRTVGISPYAIPGRTERRRIVVVEKVSSTPERYPRRWAKIQNHPL